MANRFDSPTPQKYTSTYVPEQFVGKPLDALTNLAKDYSDKYKQGQNIPSEIDDLISTVKAAPIHQDLRNSWANDAHKEIKDFVDNAKESDYADSSWQRKAHNIIKKYKTDDRLNTINSTYNFWDKEGQKYLNSDDYNSNLNYDKWKDDKGNWVQTNKDVQNIEHLKYANHLDDISKIMDKPEAYGDNGGSGIQKDGQGYFIIKNNHREYITPEQINNIAESNLTNYTNSKGGDFRFKKLLEQHGYNPRMSYQEFSTSEEIPDDVKKQARDILKSDLTGYGSKFIHTKTSGNISMHNDVIGLKKLMDEDNMPGLGQATPGSATYDLTSTMDPDIKDAFELKDGKVHFDVTKLRSGIKLEGTSGAGYTMGTSGNMSASRADNTKSHEKAARWILNAADAIGYKGKITSGSTLKNPDGSIKVMGYDDIATEYLNLGKSVSYDYKMLPQENEIVKKDIMSNPQGYTYTKKDGTPVDIKDISVNGETPFKNGNLNVGDRTYNKGQAKIEVQYLEDGKPTTLYAQPLALADKEYHNAIAKLQNAGMNFITKGKISDDNDTREVIKMGGFDKPNYTGIKPISAVKLPNGNFVVTLSDKNNKKEQYYEQLIKQPDGNYVIKPYNNLPDMMEQVNKEWFTNTNEGKGQTNYVAPKKNSFGDISNMLLTNEQNSNPQQ